ncbi:MAG: Vps62-related protein [Paludibacteraceae bacterium]
MFSIKNWEDILNSASTLITNLYLSVTDGGKAKFPKYAYANDGWWPMTVNGIDIHKACGGASDYYFLAHSNGKIAPPMPNPLPTFSDSMKIDLMNKYAPYVYMDENERFYPSTVEFTFPFLTRYKNEDGNYWVKTIEPLSSPSAVLDYFKGDIDNAKVYAFWVEKDYGIAEITYFFYYPYNRGKQIDIIDTVVGNHVGDWEHATVRLGWDYLDGSWNMFPIELYLSAHSGGNTETWDELNFKQDSFSPIIYSAQGSHAMYFAAGEYTYKKTPLFSLTDICSQGEVLDCSIGDRIVPLDYATKTNLGTGAKWPLWMNDNFTVAGNEPSSDPANGAIYRWGNVHEGNIPLSDQYRLENGPTGPISKSDVWNPNVFE